MMTTHDDIVTAMRNKFMHIQAELHDIDQQVIEQADSLNAMLNRLQVVCNKANYIAEWLREHNVDVTSPTESISNRSIKLLEKYK